MSYDFGQQCKGQGKESLFSIVDKLRGIVIELDPIISCRKGFDVGRLYRERAAVNYNLDGLSVDYQNFLIISEILKYAHYFKAMGPRGKLNVLIMFDEAKSIFGKATEKHFTIKDLVSKVREFGVGLIVADQIPSELAQYLFSNLGTLVMFRCSDGNDLFRLKNSSGATVQQMLANYSLKPGECVVRCMRSKDLQKITVPFEPVDKFISREELQRLVAPKLREWYRDVIPATERHGDRREQCREVGEVTLSERERAFLKYLAGNFERPSSHVYRALKLSNSTGHWLKRKLLKRGCISQVRTNLGENGRQAVFLIPNPMILEQLGIQLGEGRGGALHKHFQKGLKEQAETRGYEAVIELCLDESGNAADVGLSKGNDRIAVEICVTPRPQQEVAHIKKNLKQGFSEVILCFVNSRVLEATRQLANSRCDKETIEKVRFCLVNQFLDVLAEIEDG